MRRLIVSCVWVLGLGWLLIWGVSALVRDTVPTGAVWAFLSIAAWWMVGGAAKEENQNEE